MRVVETSIQQHLFTDEKTFPLRRWPQSRRYGAVLGQSHRNVVVSPFARLAGGVGIY